MTTDTYDPTELVELNLQNLVAFWDACGRERHGSAEKPVVSASRSWPGRVWLDPARAPTAVDLDGLCRVALDLPGTRTIPCWPTAAPVMEANLVEAGFERKMTQELMAAVMAELAGHPPCGLDLRPVRSSEDSELWARIAGASFGYAIDAAVIGLLPAQPGFHLVLAFDDGTAVGTGLLVESDKTAGAHMIGVPPSHRRRGYARRIMHGLLTLAAELGNTISTLQASAAARPLYEQLGYRCLGPLHSYRPAPPTTRPLQND